MSSRFDVTVLNLIKETNEFPGISRSFVSNNIKKIATLNGKSAKKSLKVEPNDIVEINKEQLSALLLKVSSKDTVVAQQGPLDIVFEDSNYLVLNKQSGIAVHPGDGNPDNTLANYVSGYLLSKGELDEQIDRGGIVHRLDKGVSGLIIFAKSKEVQEDLKAQFEKREVIKLYEAKLNRELDTKYFGDKDTDTEEAIEEVVSGVYKNSWIEVGGYIRRDPTHRKRMKFGSESAGKKALSYIKRKGRDSVYVKIETGRMHQIRATLKYLGYTIEGDSLYMSKDGQNSNRIELRSILLVFKDLSGKQKRFSIL